MIRTYFITSLRNIQRHKLITLLNVMGLAVGLAAGILILKYVQDEFSYDQFHTKKDHIYRVQHDFLKEGELDFQSARTFPKVGPAMHDDFGEVEDFCRIFMKYKGGIVRYEDNSFQEDHLLYADTSFFSLFEYELLAGNPNTVLKESHAALIEFETAKKLFGDENPVGKRISVGSMEGVEEFEITGVIKSPENSHLKFELVFSWASLIDLYGNSANDVWGNWYDFYTYVLLKENVDVYALESKLDAFADKYGGESAGSKRVKLSLQAITDIHLNSKLMMEARTNGDARTVYFLSILAAAILLIAWINYLNMATAGAMERAKEVGVRKVSGATRMQLSLQFIAEAAIVNLLAVLASFLIMILVLPYYNSFSGYELLWVNLFTDLAFWDKVILLYIIGSLISGIYPAFVLSAFQPAKVLKGNWKTSTHGNNLRKILVVAQFAASVILIAGTIIVFQQLRFMRQQSLGVNIDQVLVVKAPDVITDQALYNLTLDTYKSELLRGPNVKAVTVSSEVPGKGVSWYMGSSRLGEASLNQRTVLYVATVDYDYADLYQVELVAGRFYSSESNEDSTNLVLNEKAVKSLGFSNPDEALQQKIRISRNNYTVIGVLKDYHHESPKEEFDPTAYLLMDEEKLFFSIRTEGETFDATLEHAEERYAKIFPGTPFDYFFLNDFYRQQYEADQKLNGVFNAFSIIAIVIAALGLFGLSSFTISQRTKEVGIRKALGSSVQSIFLIFTTDFMKLVAVSNLIAIPIVWLVMNNWLDGFAHRISIGAEVFLLAALTTSMIAVIAVGYHAIKASLINPVDTLRYE